MVETSTCRVPRCGTTVDGNQRVCPRCGGIMFSSRELRRRGWVLLACGLFLIMLFATIPLQARYFLGPTVTFNLPGSTRDSVLLMIPVALIVALSLLITIAGLWQIAAGRPMPGIGTALIVTVVLLVLSFWIAGAVIDGATPHPLPRRF